MNEFKGSQLNYVNGCRKHTLILPQRDKNKNNWHYSSPFFSMGPADCDHALLPTLEHASLVHSHINNPLASTASHEDGLDQTKSAIVYISVSEHVNIIGLFLSCHAASLWLRWIQNKRRQKARVGHTQRCFLSSAKCRANQSGIFFDSVTMTATAAVHGKGSLSGARRLPGKWIDSQLEAKDWLCSTAVVVGRIWYATELV
jgi:hypothetical protein